MQDKAGDKNDQTNSNKKKRIPAAQMIRHLIQAGAFLFFPGLFLSIFNSMRDIAVSAINKTFTFASLAPDIITVLAVLVITAFFGRVFCGYLCSFGAMQELAAFISGKLLPGDRKIPERLDGILKYVKYAVLLMIVLCFWILQLPADMSFSPWGVFGIMTSGNLSAVTAAIPTMGTLLLLIILIGAFLVERSFCRYFCPLGAVLSLVSKGRLYRVRRRENECTGCMRCSRKCAMGIDIHDREEVRIGECISCMRCVGSCAPEALRADPGPAVAGTASALVLCGMISLGSSATVGAAASEQGSAVYYDAEVTTEAASETAEETEKASTDTKVSSSEEIVITEDELSQNDGFSDGVYTGTGSGLRGQTKVTVTVESGRITDITVVSYSDDREYFSKAQNSVIQAIISSQSTDVKTVSGATFSSNSIIEAVSDALGMEFSNPNSISGHGKVKR